jgi:5-methyltetrahydropteroyltriglutamate--homocysteine methyltransferase
MIKNYLGESVGQQQYEQALKDGVNDVVKTQAETGIDVIDDGEFGKINWVTYLCERLNGLERVAVEPDVKRRIIWPEQERYGDFYRVHNQYESIQWLPDTPSKSRYDGTQTIDYANVRCTSALEYDPEPLQRDIDNFKAALQNVEVEEAFIPVVAPCSIERTPNKHYDTQEAFLFALADALSDEYRMIVDAGFIVQVDDAILPMQYFLQFRARGMEAYHKWAEVRIEALNHALKGIPEDRIRYHICFGSQNIPHTTDPDLKDIIDLVLKVNAQAYCIEACNPRHEHEWQIWQDVKLPEGKILIPGVIGHATNIVEHPELIALRIRNFANLVGRENVMAGSDCGFSQGWNSPRVHSQVQWAKLESLVEGARLASRQLWV